MNTEIKQKEYPKLYHYLQEVMYDNGMIHRYAENVAAVLQQEDIIIEDIDVLEIGFAEFTNDEITELATEEEDHVHKLLLSRSHLLRKQFVFAYEGLPFALGF